MMPADQNLRKTETRACGFCLRYAPVYWDDERGWIFGAHKNDHGQDCEGKGRKFYATNHE